jgi:ABC-type branched-subunit amino acid transport system substrate-binding protein
MRRTLPLLALSLVALGCGQKSGVAGSDDAAGGAPAPAPAQTAAPAPITAAPVGGTTATPAATGADDTDTDTDDTDTDTDDTDTDDTSTAGTATAETNGEGADTTDETSVSTTQPAAETTAARVPVGTHEAGSNETAGVSDTEIVIGIHAPVTGASPIPQTSFDIGKDIYWKWLAANAPDRLFGRTVRVVFRDDEFNPNQAVSVCREMVEQEGAFMLIGGGGADQITACARYADENGIPYLSAGVNRAGLEDLTTYFATTLAYAEQAPLLVAEAQAQGLTTMGLVVTDTPSFEDAHDSILEAAEAGGIEIVADLRISKTAAEAEQLATVQELKNAGAEGIFLLSSPVVFIGLSNTGFNQGYTPLWLGPGITSGLNAVTNFGCPGVETGRFFSPTPGLDVIDALDPDFRPAYDVHGEGNAADDIGLQLWSLNKAVAMMLEATGPELGRAAFMNTLESSPGFDNGIYAPIVFTPEDHLGGTGAHLLDADCNIKQYTTAAQFVSAS